MLNNEIHIIIMFKDGTKPYTAMDLIKYIHIQFQTKEKQT